MTEQQISILIQSLRCANKITPLQKDILDTWNTIHKNPFDAESARRQILSNNINHLDIFGAISATPGIKYKSLEELTHDDMVFTLCRQFEGLIAKEYGTETNHI